MKIVYTNQIPKAGELYNLYNFDGWDDFLKLTKEELHQAMAQSWLVISAYHEDRLIGTGRIISDGIINGYLCGLIVQPDYRHKGIGSKIVRMLVEESQKANVHIELFSEKNNAPFYEGLGFKEFAVGLKQMNANKVD
ncbi:GNAT family N-acetyltransferase [Lederbergia wuyishanensis]|uniref:Ribosomal protein S18 acetylase RimI-like enzyme n=1 Tax=Lederbergia wuyishanensis TaxID=1347903 RepID=A0ABU0D617_9BACI|nr:GNAT family N-acetyltransferase [Lederbergia wuyishanensis]MCJ8008382.1 GNAT family N-acetyltransferase [Lederbergia wuyishanensis]MDQ0343796.1 ribosomal protein S18 acetylase RimI-like enzyme [Lederbergia wuyishanensis]